MEIFNDKRLAFGVVRDVGKHLEKLAKTKEKLIQTYIYIYITSTYVDKFSWGVHQILSIFPVLFLFSCTLEVFHSQRKLEVFPLEGNALIKKLHIIA